MDLPCGPVSESVILNDTPFFNWARTNQDVKGFAARVLAARLNHLRDECSLLLM